MSLAHAVLMPCSCFRSRKYGHSFWVEEEQLSGHFLLVSVTAACRPLHENTCHEARVANRCRVVPCTFLRGDDPTLKCVSSCQSQAPKFQMRALHFLALAQISSQVATCHGPCIDFRKSWEVLVQVLKSLRRCTLRVV